MTIVFDIGNSEIDIALFSTPTSAPKHFCSFQIGTVNLERAVLSWLNRKRIHVSRIESAVIGSVVPKETKRIVRFCQKIVNQKPFIAISAKNTIIPIKYYPPDSIGVDRVANAVGAIEYYKKLPIIIVDLGTATTFTVVSEKGEIIGGAITIGLRTAIESLHQETAQLPLIALRTKTATALPVIGNTTITNLQSGFYYGFNELIDGMVNRMKKELSQLPLVIATGGLASLIAPASRTIQKVDPLLTLKGLYTIFHKQ
ncbi:MAG: type III pantothenate kinase [bacterium]|nr:type III pantothenate kinase [bacterium]